jgi:hypothetical protein
MPDHIIRVSYRGSKYDVPQSWANARYDRAQAVVAGVAILLIVACVFAAVALVVF